MQTQHPLRWPRVVAQLMTAGFGGSSSGLRGENHEKGGEKVISKKKKGGEKVEEVGRLRTELLAVICFFCCCKKGTVLSR